MKRLLLLSFLALPIAHWLSAQTPVSISEFPANIEPAKVVIGVSGSGAPTHICYARPNGPWNNNSVPATYSWKRSTSTLTSIAVATNVATATTSTDHGLVVGNPLTVTGATMDTDLNASYVVATVPSSTTFTFATSGVTDGTYTESTLVLSTTAPRTTVAVWAIQFIRYDGSGNWAGGGWSNGAAGVQNQICTDYATIAYK